LIGRKAMKEETREIYRRAVLGGRVGFGVRAVSVVVDFQKSFCTAEYEGGADFSNSIENTAVLLDSCRSHGMPIVFTIVSYDSLADAGRFIEKCPTLRWSLAGQDAVSLDPRLERRESERIVVKKYASSFFGTDLSSVLTSLRADTLILSGCTTSGCIRATAVDGMQHGYRVVVPRECVADIAPEPHDANLFDIDAKYGDVVSLSDALGYVTAV
jgi:nicotinamidase-related amidase